MSKPDAPCLLCKVRFVGCHSSCRQYAAFKADVDQQRNARRRFWDEEYDVFAAASALKRRERKER